MLNRKLTVPDTLKKNGIHILGDFYQCQDGHEELFDARLLEKFCEKTIFDAGLTQVGKLFHQFPNAGVTGVILLAESHLAIHTWPEKNYLTLDVFVCNIGRDNTLKARKVYETFKNLFNPQEVNHQEISRE